MKMSLSFCLFFLLEVIFIRVSSEFQFHGEYHNRVLPDITRVFEKEKPLERDGEDKQSTKKTDILLKLLLKEPVKIKVHGNIDFARNAPAKIPKPSLLRVFLGTFRNNAREVVGSSRYKVFDTTHVDLSSYLQGKPLPYSATITVPLSWLRTGVTYHIVALLNAGWIPTLDKLNGEKKEKPWPRKGDYVATRLFTLKHDLNHYREDLHLKLYRYPSAHISHKLHHFSDLDSVPAPSGLEVAQKEVHKRSKPKYFM